MVEFPIAKLIKDARNERGMSQKALAAAAGCHPSFVTKVERLDMGGALPSRELTEAIAGVLGLEFEDLWQEVEKARAVMQHRRLRTKSAALQRTLSQQGLPTQSMQGESLDDLIAGISTDPEVVKAVRAALPYLVNTMTDPVLRQVADTALRGWSELSQRNRHKSKH